MSTFTLSPRADRGEKPKHLRQKGQVPIAIIDREHKTRSVKASLAALQAAVRGADEHGVIEFQIEGESGVRKAMLKAIEGDALTRTVLCATFQEVNESDLVKADLPVVATGHADSADGGVNLMLTAVTDVLHIRAKVSDLPNHLDVDVSGLKLGEHISAGDVALPAGIELLSTPDTVLFTLSRVAEPVLEDADLEKTPEGEIQVKGDAGVATNDEATERAKTPEA